MTPDEALSIVDTKAAGRTRFDGMEPYADEVLAAEVRRLRKLVPAWEWVNTGHTRVWLLQSTFCGSVITHGSALEYDDGAGSWVYGLEDRKEAASFEDATRQLLEYAQSKCQKP